MAKTIGPTEPDTGEATGAQRSSGPLHGLGRAGGSLGLDNFKPPAGAFKTWREMKKHPTVALARMVSTAPIRTAEIGVECEDGTDEEQVEFIKGIVKALWHENTRRILAEGHPKGRSFDPAIAAVNVAIPLHPGAERYYREAGLLGNAANETDARAPILVPPATKP